MTQRRKAGARVRAFLMNLHRASPSAAFLPIALTAIHDFGQNQAKESISKETRMPHAVASDDVRLCFEEAGSSQRRSELAMTSEASLPPARPAQQEHALLAEHVPEPPGQIEPQGTAVDIERPGPFHLHADLVAELH